MIRAERMISIFSGRISMRPIIIRWVNPGGLPWAHGLPRSPPTARRRTSRLTCGFLMAVAPPYAASRSAKWARLPRGAVRRWAGSPPAWSMPSCPMKSSRTWRSPLLLMPLPTAPRYLSTGFCCFLYFLAFFGYYFSFLAFLSYYFSFLAFLSYYFSFSVFLSYSPHFLAFVLVFFIIAAKNKKNTHSESL